ncbi:histidine kinase N-terminal 7TM domain-containing protein [Halorientalis brevis]|uniref:histidine kinase n=1 Tax=Halorientalis brevis TaxID=1126241 RepID=A0ABD6C7R3_9EURY|nr:histidine kinase N-terminal 7TM domain-containing protein [Halorientalis brevis]
MVLAVDVLGVALVLTIVPAVLMTYVAWQNSEKPGARWFSVFVLGIAGWSSTYGYSLVADGTQVTLAAVNLRYFFTDVVTITWFLLALEYVRRRRLSLRSPWLVLFVFPFCSQFVIWAVPEFVYTSWHVDRLGVFHAEFGAWFYVQTLFSYCLVVAGLALFVDDYRNAQGIRRTQTGILVAGAVIPFVANIFFVAGFSPYPDLDLTPLAFLLTTILFAWALFRYRLLELLPIARKTVLAQMQDAVITIDEDDRVVDVNEAALALFGTTERAAIGTSGREFFADYPAIVAECGEASDVDTDIEFEHDGETRHFHLQISPVSSASDLVDGRVVVLRDVTELKEREQELDLLKQVLSRVLRHNIRNDVAVVMGYAEEIAQQTTGDPAALAGQIRDKSDDIATRSQKAATIERVLTGDRERVVHDLDSAIDEAVETVRRSGTSFTVQRPSVDDCRVRALPTLPVALANLVENAVEHGSTSPRSQAPGDAVEHGCETAQSRASAPSGGHDDEVPEVRLSASCDEETVTVEVRDDGPGIPEGELSVFDQGEETPLHHSSGVGLWLVVLIARRSGGSVAFEDDGDDSVVRLTLEKA